MNRVPDHAAQTNYPVHETVRMRRSPVAFAARPVSPGDLGSLLEAARWAASSYNEQPWRFIVAPRAQPDDFDRLAACLVEANRVWAARAPLLILTLARRQFSHNGADNRHAWHDVGQATAQLALQAVALGLQVHPLGGFDRAQAVEQLGIPAAFEPVAVLAIGYPGGIEGLSPDLQQRERTARTRKPLSELVFAGRWGAVSEALLEPS